MFVTHDIDEAVFLSDRVLVMTARPGRIKEDIAIGVDRPRTFEVLTTPEFFEYKSRLLAAVREESLRTATEQLAAR
jgi:ABC-type nitrate/sulfonate/bicarbonate transport system ATPase subunit